MPSSSITRLGPGDVYEMQTEREEAAEALREEIEETDWDRKLDLIDAYERGEL